MGTLGVPRSGVEIGSDWSVGDCVPTEHPPDVPTDDCGDPALSSPTTRVTLSAGPTTQF